MARKPGKHVGFTPSPNNIRVNSIEELRDKVNYDNLSPTDRFALRLAARRYLNYLMSLPEFRGRLKQKGLDDLLDDTSSDDVAPDN